MDNQLEVVGLYVPPVMVKVASLVIDDGSGSKDYQRPERKQFDHWDWGLYDPIRVAERVDSKGKGPNHVMAGGHRTRQAVRFNIPEIPAFMIKSTGAVQEAKTFVEIDKAVKKISAIDRFKANCVANEPCTISVRNTVRKYGLKIKDSCVWPNICCVDKLMHSPVESIDFACGVVCELWNADTDALSEKVLIGLVEFHKNHQNDEKFDHEKLMKRLRGKTMSAARILQLAALKTAQSGGNSRRIKYGEVFEEIYQGKAK